MSFKKGESGNTNGRPKGIPNKSTSEFKEALNNLLRDCSPKFQQWIDKVAMDDPGKALDHVGKLAEYIYPKLARTELTGKDGDAIDMRLIDESGKRANRIIEEIAASKSNRPSEKAGMVGESKAKPDSST